MLPIWMPMEMVRPVNISLTTKDLVASHISTAELKQLISVPSSCLRGRDQEQFERSLYSYDDSSYFDC